MPNMSYNVGVLGYGTSAKVFHIPIIQATTLLNLHSIVQRSPKPDDDASKNHPAVKIYRSANDLFADKLIDIIVITSTPDTHFQFAKAALLSDKHVLVEKPFVPTSSEAQRLIEISHQTGKLLCVYQNRRWDADFLTVCQLIKEGKLGRVLEFETHFDGYRPERLSTWREKMGMDKAVGIIYDVGTHLFDQAYVLFGMPASVVAVLSNQRSGNAQEPDSMNVLLSYGNGGPLVIIKAGVISIEVKQLRYWVRGSKGSFKKYHLDVQEDQLKAGMKPTDDGFGVESDEASGSLVLLHDGRPVACNYKNVKPLTYASLYNGFREAIDLGENDAVPVKACEARDVLKIIEAARESARVGKVIRL